MFTLSEEGYRQLRLQQSRLDLERMQMDHAKFLLKQEKKAKELTKFKSEFFKQGHDCVEMVEIKPKGKK